MAYAGCAVVLPNDGEVPIDVAQRVFAPGFPSPYVVALCTGRLRAVSGSAARALTDRRPKAEVARGRSGCRFPTAAIAASHSLASMPHEAVVGLKDSPERERALSHSLVHDTGGCVRSNEPPNLWVLFT